MSGLTPSRIRSRTSELTEFFRASGHSRSPANDLSTQSQATTYSMDVPSTSSNHEGLAKKKSTRIPFLGRPRKKSNPTSGDDFARDSTEVGESSTRSTSTDRRSTAEIPDLPPHSRASMLAPSPTKSQTSLGSKLAAHFSPRTRKLSALSSKRPSESPASATSLSPPETSSKRGESLDSGSSGTRSVTPRPSQPTITVDLTSENLDEYKDLFTMPKNKKAPSQVDPTPNDYAASEPDPLPSSSQSGDSRIPTKPDEIAQRGSAPTILDTSRQKPPVSRNPRGDSPTSKTTKPTRRASPTEKQDSSTPRSSDGKDSARSSTSDKLQGPPIQRRQPIATSTPAADYSAQQRLRMRQQTGSSEKGNKPPSIPLPQPPSSPSLSGSPTPRPVSILNTSTRSSRPRSNTAGSISSVASSPPPQTPLPSTPQLEPSLPKREGSSLDLESATPAELKEALAHRNRQYDELVNHLSKTLDKHAAEKQTLEKKVSQLEREMSKKENQIKGLMWLVANNKGPPATDFPPNLTLPTLPGNLDGAQEPPKVASATRLPTRRTQLSDDSGAESHLTSGAESIRTSETSGNESGSRHRKLRRPFILGDSSYAFYRVAGGKRLPPQTNAPEGGLPELPHQGKRSSISSASLSPASSTSSLLPPSPSVTVSSLSSIPEGHSSLRYSSKPDSSDREDNKRTWRTSRMSTSSMASSSTAASSAYATNLKRSRPPSIAQVLEHSPNIPDVMEKLRHFGP